MGLNIHTNIMSHYICEEFIIKIILRVDGLFKVKLVRESTNPKDLKVTIHNISNFFNADTPGILSVDKKQIVAVCDAENLYDVVMSALDRAEKVDWIACCNNRHKVC